MTTTESGLNYEDTLVGEGDLATHGKEVKVHYTGWLTDGKKFDRIISLAKVGWQMARMLADFLDIKEASSIGTRLYTGIGKRSGQVEIYQDLHDIVGENVLLLDDVSDTGKTLQFVHSS